MRILSNSANSLFNKREKPVRLESVERDLPRKKERLSDSEIREKIRSNKQSKVGKKLVKNESSSTHVKPLIGHSDISKNEPDSEVTQEKLRKILTLGGFNFNPKEQEVLNKILSK